MATHAHPAPPHPEEAAHEEHTHHGNYVRVWAILLGLLVVSVIGPMFGIRAVTLITAFGIAVVKAYLVAKNFMHINVARRYVAYLMITCLLFMLLFFAGVAPDVMKGSGRGWVKPGWGIHATSAASHGAGASQAGGEHH
jgi:caa(3)-type oxidase subunit IV